MDYKNEVFRDSALAVMELQRDLLFHRIPEGKTKEYVDIALRAGREQAQRFSGRALGALCEERGIHVQISETTQGMAGLTFRAKIEYGEKGAVFTLFAPAVGNLMELVNPLLQPEDRFTFQSACDMLVAHEFYHYLEFKELGDTADRAPKVDIARLFGKPRQARIMRCGEVAAHAFAKEFLGLPFLPNLADYLYFVATKKWSEKDLNEKLLLAAAMLESKNPGGTNE